MKTIENNINELLNLFDDKHYIDHLTRQSDYIFPYKESLFYAIVYLTDINNYDNDEKLKNKYENYLYSYFDNNVDLKNYLKNRILCYENELSQKNIKVKYKNNIYYSFTYIKSLFNPISKIAWEGNKIDYLKEIILICKDRYREIIINPKAEVINSAKENINDNQKHLFLYFCDLFFNSSHQLIIGEYKQDIFTERLQDLFQLKNELVLNENYLLCNKYLCNPELIITIGLYDVWLKILHNPNKDNIMFFMEHIKDNLK